MVRKSYKLAGLKHTAQLKLFHPFLHSCSVMLQQEQPLNCCDYWTTRFNSWTASGLWFIIHGPLLQYVSYVGLCALISLEHKIWRRFPPHISLLWFQDKNFLCSLTVMLQKCCHFIPEHCILCGLYSEPVKRGFPNFYPLGIHIE